MLRLKGPTRYGHCSGLLGLFCGDVAERLKAPDSHSARRLAPSVGSNPTISAITASRLR
jgi:hypothetical protein